MSSNRMRDFYNSEVVPAMMKKFSYKNIMQVPKIEKIVINMGAVSYTHLKEVVTILRATHKYKDTREQFEQRTHKRLVDILNPSDKTVEALMKLDLPAGVDIKVDLKN